MVDLAQFPEEQLKPVTTGSCISATGHLVASQGSGQAVEIQLTELEVYGTADPEQYPLQKKGLSMEYLRTIAHLRPRTNTFGAVFEVPVRSPPAGDQPQLIQGIRRRGGLGDYLYANQR